MPIQTKIAVAFALLSGAALQAQVQTPPSPQAAPQGQGQTQAQKPAAPQAKSPQPPPRMLKPHAYVRRFSVGAALSVQGLKMVKARSTQFDSSSPEVHTSFTTADSSHRIGYGVTAQLVLTNRFAVTGGLFMRHVGYKVNTVKLEGTDDPSTIEVDERTLTVTNEDTRARMIDLPVLLRYYAKDRFEPGPRVFFELGGVIRRTSDVSTWTDQSINNGSTVCCGHAPAGIHSKDTRGVVAGFGVQVTDPIGIRVVPEVRYTRWFNSPFQVNSTVMRRDQIEAMISLTF